VVDVSTPGELALLGQTTLPGEPFEMYRREGLLFAMSNGAIGSGGASVVVLDVEDPTRMRQVDQVSFEKAPDGSEPAERKGGYRGWAELLKWTFEIDITDTEPFKVQIVSVFQDEPVGSGDAVDAEIVGGSSVRLRAERLGKGDSRVITSRSMRLTVRGPSALTRRYRSRSPTTRTAENAGQTQELITAVFLGAAVRVARTFVQACVHAAV
jgi:hypothetical protein